MNMSLYTITEEMQALSAMLEAGDVAEEDLRDTIEAVTLEWDAKVDDIISAIKNNEAEAEAIRAEEIRLANRRKRKERTAEWLRGYLSEAMAHLDRREYESARHRVSFRRSSRIRITDQHALVEWAKTNATAILRYKEPDISKEALGTLMEAVDVPYCFIERNDNIQIG
jgi:hypothetical protein